MARKRHARPQQLVEAIGPPLQSMVDLLVSDGGPLALSNLIAHHEQQIAFLTALRGWLEETPRDELVRYFDQRKLQLLNQPIGGTIRADEVPAIPEVLEALIGFMRSGTAPSGDGASPRRLFARMLSSEPPPPKIKKAFVEAYLHKLEARRSGKSITIETLTKKFMAYEYAKNQESALRNMQRGIKRAQTVHERCIALGVLFPPS